MAQARSKALAHAATGLGRALDRLEVLALFPLVAIAAIWLNLDTVLMVTVFALPALLMLRTLGKTLRGTPHPHTKRYEQGTAADGRDAMLATLQAATGSTHDETACFLMQIDGWTALVDRIGTTQTGEVSALCLSRICALVRHEDLVVQLGDARFGVVLHPGSVTRLGTRDSVATRLQEAVAEPIVIQGTTLRLTACIGHSALLSDRAHPARDTLAAAEAALAEAHRSGANRTEAYAPGLLRARAAQNDLTSDVQKALTAGEVQPWFQPQLRADTGVISGFEALARWRHPTRGLLCPREFLPAIEDAGQMGALGQVMLRGALDALQTWDAAGLRIPSVALNLSACELRDPLLVDRIAWEADRCDIRPARLTIEILETVATTCDDRMVTATIEGFRDAGFDLDLDDFGIGQASLSAIRRFGVKRIKIDRSYIEGLEHDPEQKAMVAAILSMARHLQVEVLAEGVETAESQSLLAQMGCDFVQGFHLARPMPLGQTVAWATCHNQRLAEQGTTSALARQNGG